MTVVNKHTIHSSWYLCDNLTTFCILYDVLVSRLFSCRWGRGKGLSRESLGSVRTTGRRNYRLSHLKVASSVCNIFFNFVYRNTHLKSISLSRHTAVSRGGLRRQSSVVIGIFLIVERWVDKPIIETLHANWTNICALASVTILNMRY